MNSKHLEQGEVRRLFIGLLPSFFTRGVANMSAEQHRPFQFFERWFSRKVIKQFDPYATFLHFQQDVSLVGLEAAKIKRRNLIEVNLNTYVQEAIGDRTIFPYATRVALAKQIPQLQENSKRVVYQNIQFQDVINEQSQNLESVSDEELKAHYIKEHKLWELVWEKLTDDVRALLGKTDVDSIREELLLLGAKERIIKLQEDKKGKSFNSDPFFGLRTILPSLEYDEELELIELPNPVVFASPTFRYYHDGQTSIARHARMVFIPKACEFVIIAEGLFTAYPDDDIANIHLFGESPTLPKHKEELFWLIQTLSEEYRDLAPTVIFQKLIDVIGRFDQVPTGQGVVAGSLLQRNLTTQIAYLEKIFDFEHEQAQNNPERLKKLETLLKQPTELVMHSALRGRHLDVEALFNVYIEAFATLPNNLGEAKKKFLSNSLLIHSDFGNRVVSLIDCGTGTVLGGQSPNLLKLQAALGMDRLSTLQALDSNPSGITTREELENFCKLFNKDPALFSTKGTCALCGKHTYIWSRETGGCNVCPVCEVKDDLGVHGEIDNPNENTQEYGEEAENLEMMDTRSTNLSNFVCSLTSGTSALFDS